MQIEIVTDRFGIIVLSDRNEILLVVGADMLRSDKPQIMDERTIGIMYRFFVDPDRYVKIFRGSSENCARIQKSTRKSSPFYK